MKKKLKNFLKKIQDLPLEKKKKILWLIVVIFAIIFFFLYVKITIKRWEKIGGQQKKEIPVLISPTSSEFLFLPSWQATSTQEEGASEGFSDKTKKELIEFLESWLKDLKEEK